MSNGGRISKTDPDAERAILTLAAARGGEKTICPSEAARALHPDDWRAEMPRVHAAAATLARRGTVALTQAGEVGRPGAIVGAYRIAILGRGNAS